VVEPQDGYAPRVLHVRIEKDAVLLPREHLAEPAEADDRRIVFADRRLERLAVSGQLVRHARELGASAAALEVVAANEIRMPIDDVAKPRDVRRDRPPIVERRLGADAGGNEPAAANPHEVLAEVTAEQPR